MKKKNTYIVSGGKPQLAKNTNQFVPESLLVWHEGWVEFLKKFGIIIDLADYPILPHIKFEPNQDYWSITTPPDFNPIKVCQIRNDISEIYALIHPSEIIDISPRAPVCFVRANQNSNVEYPNISCEQSIRMGLRGTTFTEGGLLDARVLVDLGIHLDEDNFLTMHTGSFLNHGHKDVVCTGWRESTSAPISEIANGDEWFIRTVASSGVDGLAVSLRSKQF